MRKSDDYSSRSRRLLFLLLCYIILVSSLLGQHNVQAWMSMSTSKMSTSTTQDEYFLKKKKKCVCNSDVGGLLTRREWGSMAAAATTFTVVGAGSSTAATASAATTTSINPNGLASRLAKRDASVLVNPIFNIPPSVQVYPDFMRNDNSSGSSGTTGIWDISCKFGGYLFPSTKIPRDVITSNPLTPGFQKCSIAAICDVGKDFTYKMKIDPITGVEDRIYTLSSQINSSLNYNAVSEIIYNGKVNPNRISIDFVEYRTRNAERIELFCNARESEYVDETGVFVCSEAIRQVTFGTGSTQNVPRQVVGNYAHFWTWKKNPDNPASITGNLLTAAYLDPQDPLYFQEPSRPVAVYSHILTGTKIVV